MPNESYALVALILMAFATFMTRSAPFLLLGKFEDHPHLIQIGRNLPPAVMVILVVYCLKDVKIYESPFGIPELFSVMVVAGLQLWKRNALLSILVGMAFYLILISIEK